MRGTLLTNIGDQRFNMAFVNNPAGTAAPGVNDDITAGYEPGSMWIYAGSLYVCTSNADGAATWILLEAGSDAQGVIAAPAASTPTGTGSNASLTGGAGGATSGDGGDASLIGGAATAGNSNGGSAVVQGGAGNGAGKAGSVRQLGVVLKAQAAQVTQDTAATLTAAQLLNGIIQSTPAGAINLTLPTEANMDAEVPDAVANDSFDFSIVNTSGGANTITVLANGWTLVGTMTIAQNVAGRFRARKNATAEWHLIRIS